MRYFVWWALGLLLIVGAARAADQPYFEVHGQTDRTAFWVADRFHYVITVVHDPQVRFVTDHLQKSTLNLEPFEVLGLQYRENPAAAGRKKLEIDLLLTTYEAEPREIEIPSFNLFYFVDNAAATPNSNRPAETLVVPPVPVVLRSTIPENASSIRDGISPPATPFRYRAALPFAIGMLVVAMVLLAPIFFHGKRLHTAQEISRRRKQAQEQLHNSLIKLLARPVDSEAQMSEFYEEANQTLREFLSAVSVSPTEGKTPRELATMFANGSSSIGGIPHEPLRDILGILQACEQVRYASNGFLLGRERHGSMIERLRTLAADK